jgi:DNA-binding NarL/FixJ family response regulator
MSQLAMTRVLIAHGDPLIAAGVAATLRERLDFAAVACTSELTASRGTGTHLPSADVVIADYDSGLRLLMSGGGGSHRVVILTHWDSEAKIAHALKQGASGYILLGCSLRELIDSLRTVHAGGLALGPQVADRVVHCVQQRALTRREAEVLRHMMLGLSNKAIGSRLTVTVGTVKTHVGCILDKLHAKSRTEAVTIAHRRGILGEGCSSRAGATRE